MLQSEWFMLDIISLVVYRFVPQQSKNWKELRLLFFFFFWVLLSSHHSGKRYSYISRKSPPRAFCQLSQRNAAVGHSVTPALSQTGKPCQQTRHKQSFRGDELPSSLNFCEFRFVCHLIEFLFS